MRLIDADALLKKTGWVNLYGKNKSAHVVFSKDIHECPTIEAVPVVHGEWILVSDDLYGFISRPSDYYLCSSCHGASERPTAYCPNCGAKMIEAEPQEENDVKCIECKYLMFSDCYGECSKAYMGIVHPWDSCGRGEKKDKDNKECKDEDSIR